MRTRRHDSLSTVVRRRVAAVIGSALLLLAGVFMPSVEAQTFKVLHKFKGNPDGYAPYGGVVLDRAGNVYGTTSTGGAYTYGTVFKIDISGKLTVLHTFIKGEGANPFDSLLLDKAGNLYGTNSDQGYHNSGTVFELSPGGKLAPLHRFTGGLNGDGFTPWAPLIGDEVGNLYGTTANGGPFGEGTGTVFKVDGQTGQETVLYSFGLQPDGAIPYGWVVRDALGNLYGTTVSGGAFCNPGCGTVFKLDPSGVETVMYSFTGGSDGNQPGAGLTLDSEGNLYGTTIVGGAFNNGTVFKLDPRGTFTVLHSFGAPGDGGQPIGSGVIRDAAGNLYGTTQYGGVYGNGTVYKLASDGTVTILHSFSGGADGGAPWAGVSQDRAGNLYGTTRGGGDTHCICGVVYKITP